MEVDFLLGLLIIKKNTKKKIFDSLHLKKFSSEKDLTQRVENITVRKPFNSLLSSVLITVRALCWKKDIQFGKIFVSLKF